jgi:hypothetical protein
LIAPFYAKKGDNKEAKDNNIHYFLVPIAIDTTKQEKLAKKFPAENICWYCFLRVFLFCRELFGQLFPAS